MFLLTVPGCLAQRTECSYIYIYIHTHIYISIYIYVCSLSVDQETEWLFCTCAHKDTPATCANTGRILCWWKHFWPIRRNKWKTNYLADVKVGVGILDMLRNAWQMWKKMVVIVMVVGDEDNPSGMVLSVKEQWGTVYSFFFFRFVLFLFLSSFQYLLSEGVL